MHPKHQGKLIPVPRREYQKDNLDFVAKAAMLQRGLFAFQVGRTSTETLG